MPAPRRPVLNDRRGVATVEFVFALPVCMVMMFGLADVAQLGRGHMRAQSAATQIGQIVSQCERFNAADETILKNITRNLLGTYAYNSAQWELRITAFGQKSDGTAINWSVQANDNIPATGPRLTVSSKGSALPEQSNGADYVMAKNNLLYRTEVFVRVDRTPLTRGVSVVAQRWDLASSFDSVRGEAVHSTRSANTDELATKTSSKGCLS